jgi:hypothetical protein
MKDYFYDSLGTAFGNVVYTKWGPVGLCIMGNEEDTVIRLVAYDSPTAFINQLSKEEKENHVLYSKQIDISDVHFNIEYSVYKKLNEIVSQVEKEAYSTGEY